MVLLFGFGPGEAKDLGEVAPVTCPNCHNNVFLRHLQSKEAVRLYFVPVVPYGTDEYLLCPICNRGLQLKDGQQAAVGAMQATTAAFRAGRMAPEAYQAQRRTSGVSSVSRPAGSRCSRRRRRAQCPAAGEKTRLSTSSRRSTVSTRPVSSPTRSSRRHATPARGLTRSHASRQRIAIGLTGEPVAVGIRNGAITHKNDQRFSSSHC
jgi:hypothetical protein